MAADHLLSLSQSGTGAVRYWRACCALALGHALGSSWPLETEWTPRASPGHWGCNPGIAWIIGHLADGLADEASITAVIGTGHATSFM